MPRPNNDKEVAMNQLHRPQRTVRKDPFPQVPFVVDDTDVPGDKFAGWACCVGAVLVLLLGWAL